GPPMNYHVTWRPSAEQHLAHLRTSAADRNAVRVAADQIDDDLERAPLVAGEARGGTTRIHIVPPLAVYFDVDVAQREVSVWAGRGPRPVTPARLRKGVPRWPSASPPTPRRWRATTATATS